MTTIDSFDQMLNKKISLFVLLTLQLISFVESDKLTLILIPLLPEPIDIILEFFEGEIILDSAATPPETAF